VPDAACQHDRGGAPDTISPDQRKQLILRQLATMASQSLADTLVILELGRVRIRQ
jgi:hypothetical protein